MRRTAAMLALLVAGTPLVVACTFHATHPDPQGPEPSNGPFASVGTETVPAVP
jgi:hypothetical protein